MVIRGNPSLSEPIRLIPIGSDSLSSSQQGWAGARVVQLPPPKVYTYQAKLIYLCRETYIPIR